MAAADQRRTIADACVGQRTDRPPAVRDPSGVCQCSCVRPPGRFKGEKSMLETIAVILVVLWLVGLVTSTTMGGLIHALLVIAVVVILIRVIQGRRV